MKVVKKTEMAPNRSWSPIHHHLLHNHLDRGFLQGNRQISTSDSDADWPRVYIAVNRLGRIGSKKTVYISLPKLGYHLPRRRHNFTR